MNYLNEIGISKETLRILKINYSKEELESLDNCIDRVEDSILYLRELGVSNRAIESILIVDFHTLMPGRKYLEKALSKVLDLDQFIKAINTDTSYIDYLKNIN